MNEIFKITVTRETEQGENSFTYSVTGEDRVATERAQIRAAAKPGETVTVTAERA